MKKSVAVRLAVQSDEMSMSADRVQISESLALGKFQTTSKEANIGENRNCSENSARKDSLALRSLAKPAKIGAIDLRPKLF